MILSWYLLIHLLLPSASPLFIGNAWAGCSCSQYLSSLIGLCYVPVILLFTFLLPSVFLVTSSQAIFCLSVYSLLSVYSFLCLGDHYYFFCSCVILGHHECNTWVGNLDATHTSPALRYWLTAANQITGKDSVVKWLCNSQTQIKGSSLSPFTSHTHTRVSSLGPFTSHTHTNLWLCFGNWHSRGYFFSSHISLPLASPLLTMGKR